MKPSLHLTAVHLRVANLTRSRDFYTQQLGLIALRQTAGQAELGTAGAAAPLLILTEDRAAPPQPPDAAGLFHAALLFPGRPALGAWLSFAGARGVEFDGFSDYGVSESIYFSDPDGNGLEFYADRPRESWPFHNGELAMVTQTLDVESLIAAGTAPGRPKPDETRIAAGAHWGHLHLRVTDLDRSDAFYRKTLGMQLTQGSFPGGRFLAADGYHHHLGLNNWGRPRQPRLAGALGLVRATFAHAGAAASEEINDPDGIGLRITPLEGARHVQP